MMGTSPAAEDSGTRTRTADRRLPGDTILIASSCMHRSHLVRRSGDAVPLEQLVEGVDRFMTGPRFLLVGEPLVHLEDERPASRPRDTAPVRPP